MSVLQWIGKYNITKNLNAVKKVYIANTLGDIVDLQLRHSSHLVALPTGTKWYELDRIPNMDYSTLCANAIFHMPYIAFEVVQNTKCRYLLVEENNLLVEFTGKDTAISYNCKVRPQLI
jgi:hypothetical protein